jgi:hypothetical protein
MEPYLQRIKEYNQQIVDLQLKIQDLYDQNRPTVSTLSFGNYPVDLEFNFKPQSVSNWADQHNYTRYLMVRFKGSSGVYQQVLNLIDAYIPNEYGQLVLDNPPTIAGLTGTVEELLAIREFVEEEMVTIRNSCKYEDLTSFHRVYASTFQPK